MYAYVTHNSEEAYEVAKQYCAGYNGSTHVLPYGDGYILYHDMGHSGYVVTQAHLVANIFKNLLPRG